MLCVSNVAVIGFEPGNIQTQEGISTEQEVELRLLTPTNGLPAVTLASTLEATIRVNQTLSTATFGNSPLLGKYSKPTVA